MARFEEAGYDMTALAMNEAGIAPGDEQLLVKFFTEPTENKAKSAVEGRPIFEDTVFISIRTPGSRDEVLREVRDADIDRFPRHWAAFQNRQQENQVEGTLLSEWPGIARSQAEELRFFSIETVEQLATAGQQALQKIMGGLSLQEKAKKYLEASNDQAAANALKAAEERNKNLEEQVAALTEAINDMKADMAEQRPKPRGRRRRVETPDDE